MSLYALLEQVIRSVESEIRKRPFYERAVFWIFMPLKINFVTQLERASITVMRDASLRLSRAVSAPDIILTSDYETLKDLVFSPSKEKFLRAERDGQIRIDAHTPKGQQAISYVRKMFGA
jgi:hypothetical protein